MIRCVRVGVEVVIVQISGRFAISFDAGEIDVDELEGKNEREILTL